MTLSEILRAHAQKYEHMQPTDAIKLVYQNEFGGGHLVKDSAASLLYIRTELERTPKRADEELFTHIGNGIVRVNFSAVDECVLSPECLNEIFVKSASEVKGSIASFEKKLQELYSLAEEGIFSFSKEALSEYIAEHKRLGYPPVSHSPEYRAAYSPAYRIVLEKYISDYT